MTEKEFNSKFIRNVADYFIDERWRKRFFTNKGNLKKISESKVAKEISDWNDFIRVIITNKDMLFQKPNCYCVRCIRQISWRLKRYREHYIEVCNYNNLPEVIE